MYWWRGDACFLFKSILRNLYSHNSEVSPVCKNIDLCYSLFRNNAVLDTGQKSKSSKNHSAQKAGQERFGKCVASQKSC